MTREQLGWAAPESVVARFEETVASRYGAVSPYKNQAVEIALREVLDNDKFATLEDRIRRVVTALGDDPPSRERPHLPQHVREQNRTKMWVSVHPELKREVSAFAEERGLDKWEVLTAALREYINGGRAERLQDMLSPVVVDELESELVDDHRTGADSASVDDTHGDPSDHTVPPRSETTLAETNFGISTGGGNNKKTVDPIPEINNNNNNNIDTPITPVYPPNQQLEATIAKLPGDTKGLPRPFSRSELYRAAAESGLYVWTESMQEHVKDQICTRLDYEWNPDAEKFVPIIDPIVKDVIRDATAPLKSILTDLPAELQDDVEQWRDLHGLNRLEDPNEILARQALFRHLLRATVFEHYHRRGDLPELSGNIRQRFRQAREQTDNPVFETCVLDELVWEAGQDFTNVIEERHRLVVARQPAEVIGRLLSSLTSNDSRKQLGQFRTPPVLGDVMRRWVSEDSDSPRILDPGIGAAALASPSYRYWTLPAGLASEYVEGIDRSPLGATLAATALTLHNESHTIWIDDFLSLSPDCVGEFNGIVCNPPFTKHHDLTEEYKSEVIEPIKQDYNISGNVPLYVYFYFHLKEFLSPGDRVALISPYFLDTKHGAPVVEDMLTTYDVEAFVKFDLDDPVFPDAETTCMITLLKVPSEEQSDSAVQFIRVTDRPDEHTLLNAITGTPDDNPDWGSVTSVQQTELDPDQNLSIRFTSLDIDPTQHPSLSDLASISTLITTGWNNAFCLSHSEVDEFGIDEKHLVPLIRSKTNLQYNSDSYRFDYRRSDWNRQREFGNEVYLLSVESTVTGDGSESGITAYLDHWATKLAEEPDQHQEVRKRDPWYELSLPSPSRIVVPALSRDKFPFVANEMGAHALKNMLGVDPNPDLTETEVKALLAYLNSALADDLLDCYSKDHPGGANVLRKGDLKDLPVIDSREVPDKIATDLATAFDRLREAARAGDSIDAILDEIDELVQKALKYQTGELQTDARPAT